MSEQAVQVLCPLKERQRVATASSRSPPARAQTLNPKIRASACLHPSASLCRQHHVSVQHVPGGWRLRSARQGGQTAAARLQLPCGEHFLFLYPLRCLVLRT